MTKVDDGGPAFPHLRRYVSQDVYEPIADGGMSLRDWFAGQALVAAWDARDKGYFEGDDHDMAQCAYQMADAMIAARGAK